MTVYILGDSITKGVYISENGRYSVNKESYMQGILEALGHPFKNFSAFGATITKGLNIYSRQKKSMEKNSYVFLEFGGNDCNFEWDKVAEDPKAAHIPNTPLKEYARCYAELIDQLKEEGFKPVLMSLPPLNAKAFYSYLCKLLDGKALLEYLGKVENIYYWQEDYDKELRKLAKEKELPLIDLRKVLLEKEEYQELICEDGMHLTLAGQKLLREKLYEPIMKLLGSKA